MFLFAVEDKVKDQLDAANPEPIIEEVVSKNIYFFKWCFSSWICQIKIFFFLRIWPTSLLENLTGESMLKAILTLKFVDIDNITAFSLLLCLWMQGSKAWRGKETGEAGEENAESHRWAHPLVFPSSRRSTLPNTRDKLVCTNHDLLG